MDLIQLLIVILVLGLVFALLYWLIDQFTFLPAPFVMMARAILALIIVVLLLGIVFGQINVPSLRIGR